MLGAGEPDALQEGAPLSETLLLLQERLKSGSLPGQRTDGYRIVLSVEGGGMRGTVTAGMAYALHERGLLPAFDAVYGTSAGAITAAWLLSSNPDGLRGWARPDYARTLISWSALLRRRPVVDVETLVEVVYRGEFPMDFEVGAGQRDLLAPAGDGRRHRSGNGPGRPGQRPGRGAARAAGQRRAATAGRAGGGAAGPAVLRRRAGRADPVPHADGRRRHAPGGAPFAALSGDGRRPGYLAAAGPRGPVPDQHVPATGDP